tara:strand:+ start:27 stop:413 length:387 start_codon:yes stop_codon:yes gene_type:complete
MALKIPYNTKYFSSRSKYGAKKTIVDGKKFDSKWEAERYGQLKAMEKAGFVKKLQLQQTFKLYVNDMLICKYIADFVYEKETPDGDVEEVVEDTKGFETQEFKLKKKLMKALYNIDIYVNKKKNKFSC